MNNTYLKTCSCKEVIAALYNQFGFSSNSMAGSIYEFIGDAIAGIGFHANSIVKTETVCIENHFGSFPCNLYSITGVYYDGYRLPLGMDISLYGIIDWNSNAKTVITETQADELNRLITLLGIQKDNYDDYLENGGLATDAQAEALLDLVVDTTDKIAAITSNYTLGKRTSALMLDYYNVNQDGIVTSFKDGELKVIYNAFPTDNENFPMIIDTFKYKQAVLWYCVYALSLRGYNHPKIKWQDALALWEKYRGQASNEAKMPNQDKLEQFKNMWTSSKFIANRWENFFINGEQLNGLIQ